jgi:branched-chain amino acid aminotransferase
MAISLKITKTQQSRIDQCDFNNIQFGTIFADHMFCCNYENGTWQDAEIQPFGPIALSPSISALHYGQSIFEGMKAFKNAQTGAPQLFRPLDNWRRLNVSAGRMAMPELPEEIFMEGLSQLIRLDKDWIPTKEGSSLYIRPFMFATDEFVGVRPSQKFSFIIFTCPVNSYYPKPIRVQVEQKYTRAFKGGAGFAKAAGNYGISMLPTLEAQRSGFDQLIWTDGSQHDYVEESGTMNIFLVVKGEVITPPVGETILAGITRDSVIKLLRNAGYSVTEKPVSVKEIAQACERGEVEDAFGTGTAALIAKIQSITYAGKTHELPAVEQRKVSNFLYAELENIRTSQSPDPFNWVVPV